MAWSVRPVSVSGCVVQSAQYAARRLPTRFSSQIYTTPTRLFSASPSRNSSSSESYTYAVSASFTAKGVAYEPSANIYNHPSPFSGSRSFPTKRRALSGQDSFFISTYTPRNAAPPSPTDACSQHTISLGITDGVGGWADSGVDPADFSHGLCRIAAHIAAEPQSEVWLPKTVRTRRVQPVSPVEILHTSYHVLAHSPLVAEAGGSTACYANLHPSGSVDIANLGDSGYVHLRRGAVHAKSEPQTHAFNTPYQLSLVPKYIRERARAFGGEQLQDLPSDADLSEQKVKHGDVLVFGTDGVWDNMSASETLQIVSKVMTAAGAWKYSDGKGISVAENLHDFAYPAPLEQPEFTMLREELGAKGKKAEAQGIAQFVAQAVTGEAKKCSMDPARDGPFAREVQRHYPGEQWRGGKEDDICVVVVVVVENGRGGESASASAST